jgi:chaperone modulatory protein CbpM
VSARRRLAETQVVRTAGVTTAELRVWCDSGWVTPAHGENGGQVFDEIDVARVCLVRELRHDLGLDDEAIPVILSLLDQLYGVRRELRTLARAVEQQEGDVAARVRAAYRALAGDG